MSLRAELLFKVARNRVLTRQVGAVGENQATFDPVAYRQWRDQELRQQFMGFFSAEDVRGRDVLDFGCGEGGLAFMVAKLGPKTLVGMDLAESLIKSANAQIPFADLPIKPRFLVAQDPARVELETSSIDVILCFDVLEHVMQPSTIVREWMRVLRPGGKVLIWWVPWWNPWGPHIESLVPIPWAHVVCDDADLIGVCARIYDMPQFRPRIWDLDEQGRKKPNKWRTMEELPGVNRLTIREFESLCEANGLAIESRVAKGFGSSGLARLTHPLLKVPVLRDYFTSCVAYKITKPVAS
jgi:SAM-dependent methyltransferase